MIIFSWKCTCADHVLVVNIKILLICLLQIQNREETDILPPMLKRFVDQEAVNFIENTFKFLMFKGILKCSFLYGTFRVAGT